MEKKPEKGLPACAICGSASPFLMEKDGYGHYRCPSCGMVFVYPQPSGSFLADEVYSEKSGYQSNKARNLSALVPTKKQKRLLRYLAARLAGSSEKEKFLDVGCSSGDLMYFASKLGYKVSGVELNGRTVAIAKANGLDVQQKTLEQAHFPDASFDCIHMGDLIEHVPDPRALVRDAKRILKKGGELIVITPNTACFWSYATYALWELFRIPWAMMTPPHHLFNFSDKNLRMLVEGEGFSFKEEWYCHAPTLKYSLGSLHLVKRWKQNKTVANLAFAGFSFALYAIIYGLNWIAEWLPVKRFAMAMVFRKQ